MHFVRSPLSQSLGHPLDIVTCRASSHVPGYQLEGPFVACTLRVLHGLLEGRNLKFAGLDEGIDVEFPRPEGRVGALDCNGAGVLELCTFALVAGADWEPGWSALSRVGRRRWGCLCRRHLGRMWMEI